MVSSPPPPHPPHDDDDDDVNHRDSNSSWQVESVKSRNSQGACEIVGETMDVREWPCFYKRGGPRVGGSVSACFRPRSGKGVDKMCTKL